MNKRKILLGTVTAAVIATPIATVVSCGIGSRAFEKLEQQLHQKDWALANGYKIKDGIINRVIGDRYSAGYNEVIYWVYYTNGKQDIKVPIPKPKEMGIKE